MLENAFYNFWRESGGVSLDHSGGGGGVSILHIVCYHLSTGASILSNQFSRINSVELLISLRRLK